MAGNMRFEWNAGAFAARVRAASERTLEGLRPDAQAIWVGVVPVRTGHLRDSWFSRVEAEPHAIILVFGATAHYAIFVEFGTIHMAPRAPIRRTAEQLAPTVLPRLFQELAA